MTKSVYRSWHHRLILSLFSYKSQSDYNMNQQIPSNNIKSDVADKICQNLKSHLSDDERIMLMYECVVRICYDGRRKVKQVVLTNQSIYVFKKGDLRYSAKYQLIKKVIAALYSSDVLILFEKDGWIFDTFDYRTSFISLLKMKTPKNTPFKLTDDTFLGSQLMRHKKKEKKQAKTKKAQNEILNLKQLKIQWFNKKKEEGKNDQILSKYEIITPLLTSGYWETFLAKDRSKQSNLTIKTYKKETIVNNKQILFYIINESVNLQNVLSPYIPVLHRFFYTPSHIVLVLEFYDGLLLSELGDLAKLQTIKLLISEIIMAIGHLHECGIVYADLGLHSVLLNHDGHIILHNLGISRQKNQPLTCNLKDSSPECNSKNIADYPLDWWQLGLLIYHLFEGRHIFAERTESQIKKELNSSEELKINFHKTPQELRLIIENLLVKDPVKRLGYQNDYHSILVLPYFSEINKKELLVKQGPALKKLVLKEKVKSKNITVRISQSIITEFDQTLDQYLFNRDLDEI